jgi:predicted MFS family arabinose efflux permease
VHRPRRAAALLTGAAPPAARLHRDRLTWLVYGHLGAYGFFLYGFGPTVPLLREEQGTSLTVAGLHGTALAGGALVSSFFTPALVRARGRGAALWGGLAAMCAGIVAYTSSTALAVTLLGTLLASIGGSTTINATAPALGEHHGTAGAAAVSEGNACAAGVGMLGPLVVGAAVASGLGWRAGPLVTLALVAVLALVFGRTPIPAPHAPPPDSGGAWSLPKRYWVLWGALIASVGAEFCLALWAADELRGHAGLGAAAASAAVTAFVGGMALGRIVGGRLALRLPADGLLLGAVGVAGAGFALFWSSTLPVLALAGLLATGLGVSLLYPLGIVLAIAASGGRPDLATARAGFGVAIAVGLGPFALGALGDAFGTHRAFLLVPGLLVVAAVGVLLERRTARALPQ